MQELSEQQLQVSDKKNIEGVTEKYLQPILEVLDRKNIKGVRLLKQGNRVMLLIDKSQLNSMNTDILHAMNMVYPNHVVCIEDIENPFDYEELYEDMPIVNSGKAGYKTQDILEEMDELVYQYNPTKVVILIGTNDLNNDVPEDKMLENIEKIIKDIKKNRKKAKLYVQSIYPINNSDNDKINKDTVGVRTNETIQRVNKQIKKICKQQNVTYIDMYSELVDNEGNLILKYTKDGLHISELGYLKITRILLSYLEN